MIFQSSLLKSLSRLNQQVQNTVITCSFTVTASDYSALYLSSLTLNKAISDQQRVCLALKQYVSDYEFHASKSAYILMKLKVDEDAELTKNFTSQLVNCSIEDYIQPQRGQAHAIRLVILRIVLSIQLSSHPSSSKLHSRRSRHIV